VIKSNDGLPFPLFQPEIPGKGGIMLVGFAVSIYPSVELALADGQPVNEAIDRDAGFVTPCPGKINNGVSCIVGNPDAG
jgi:hypothetical protein